MRSYSTQTLEMDEEQVLIHSPREYLALVDLETYPAFVGKATDHLDMIAHLSAQLRALTAVAWGSPKGTLHLRLVMTEDDRVVEREARSSYCTTASGWVRTQGRLCLTSHDRLYDCARHQTHDVLREERLPKNARPQVLLVPPGVYWVLIYYHFPFPFGGGSAEQPHVEPKNHYTVTLRRYPFPAHRVAPVRLPGFVPTMV